MGIKHGCPKGLQFEGWQSDERPKWHGHQMYCVETVIAHKSVWFRLVWPCWRSIKHTDYPALLDRSLIVLSRYNSKDRLVCPDLFFPGSFETLHQVSWAYCCQLRCKHHSTLHLRRLPHPDQVNTPRKTPPLQTPPSGTLTMDTGTNAFQVHPIITHSLWHW